MIPDLVIQLITLYETPERERSATEQLNQLGVPYQINRFHRHKVGWRGCIESHINIFKEAKKKGTKQLLICEDNIQVASLEDKFPLGEKFRNLYDFFKRNPKWEIVFLGGYIHRSWDVCQPTIWSQVYETKNYNHGTVAYYINEPTYLQILDLHEISPINEHYDIFLTKFTSHIYRPFVFYHKHNITSNINQHSDVWRKVWFHPSAMAVHEKMYFDRYPHYLLLIIIILGGLWWILKRRPKSE